MPPNTEPTTVADVQRLCHRARAAGAPNARARGPLAAEYRRLAAALGAPEEDVASGRDLQRAAAGLLRAAAAAEVAAAATPAARLRRAGRPTL